MGVNWGAASFFAVGEASPIVLGANGVILDIINENVAETRGIIDGNAMKGYRSRHANRAREGIRTVGGSFSFNPVTSDLAYFLKKALGGTPAAQDYPLADTLPSFVIQKSLGGTNPKVETFPTNYVNTMTLSASRGQPLTADVGVLGLSRNTAAAAPSGAGTGVDYTHAMLVFHDLILTIGGSPYVCHDFSWTINNSLDVQMVNSRDVTAIFPTDRIVTVATSVPDADIAHSAVQDIEVAVSAALTFNNQSLTLAMGTVRFTTVSPVAGGRGEIRYGLTGQAYRASSGTAELVTTLDSTP
jgi:hypothetical protein